MAREAGSLTVVATPIGNLDDLSARAAKALSSADFWIVEDSRVSAKLQARLGVKRPMRVLNDHTPQAKVSQYVDEIEGGAADAGSRGGAARDRRLLQRRARLPRVERRPALPDVMRYLACYPPGS
ncbi:MAG: hypothetical protein IH945_12180 [Armatimonadetes bacterium]|nr:hypothetical protein [Armatimonadota bacterium]